MAAYDVAMLLTNPMTNDSRVEKEAETLAAAGLSVVVVALAAEGLAEHEQRGGYEIKRIHYDWVPESVRKRSSLDGSATKPSLAKKLVTLGIKSVRKVLQTVFVSRHRVRAYRRSMLPHVPEAKVVHAHDLMTLETGARLAESWGVPLVYDSHELYTEIGVGWNAFEKWLWERFERRWIAEADLVVTVSPEIADELHRRYSLRNRPLVVKNAPPCGVPSASDVRSDCSVGPDTPLAVYAGGVTAVRGVDHVVEAIAGSADWHLAIVGGGPGAAELAPLVASLGVDDRVHVLEPRPAAELPAYLSTGDVGVHALLPTCLNHEYALPNKLFDYLQAGLPVAVSDLTSMRSLLSAAGVGEFFDPTRPGSILAALHRVQENRARYRAAVATGRWDWGPEAATLLEGYRRLGAL